MIALSDLLGAEVRSRRGETLGRVRDVHVRLTAEGTWEVDRLMLGRRGLAVRLGIPTARPATDANSVPWTDVRSVQAGLITTGPD